MVVLKQEDMNKLLFIFCATTLLSCGGKKEFNRSSSVENIESTEQLHAALYRTTHLLELLDVKIRQVETRDSSGNVRVETKIGIGKRTEANRQDSAKIFRHRHEERKKVVNQDTKKKRSGVINSWARITGFVAVILVVLSIQYLTKRL